MIEWGQKSKPQKISRASNKTPKNPWTDIYPPPPPKKKKNPMPNFWAIKIYLRNHAAGIRGNYHESSDWRYLPKFSNPPPPKIPILKISNSQKSFNHPCPLKFGVPRWELKQGCDLHVPAIMAPHKICLVEPPCLAKEISFWAPFNFS